MSVLVCKRCGVPCGLWSSAGGTPYWKHQNGWRGKKSCGQKPVPITREEYDAAEQRALDAALGAPAVCTEPNCPTCAAGEPTPEREPTHT